ncbi:MAG: DUF47 family protein [Olegusella sp.]|nr:DUF47 family protein [Olegusella sp.]
MSRVKQREDVFYRMLDQFGSELVKTSDLYLNVFDAYPDADDLIKQMHGQEHACDDCTQRLMVELAQSFITPFDREDIVALTRSLDDVADAMDNVATRLEIFHVNKMHPDAIHLAELTVKTVAQVKQMLDYLPDFKKDKRVTEVCKEICDLEDQGDHIYHRALSTLYEDDVNALHALKWTKLFDKMEDGIDSCKEAANVVMGVVIKNA